MSAPATEWATDDGRYWARRARCDRFTFTTTTTSADRPNSTDEEQAR